MSKILTCKFVRYSGDNWITTVILWVCSQPLLPSDMHKMGMRVSGATGQAKLKVCDDAYRLVVCHCRVHTGHGQLEQSENLKENFQGLKCLGIFYSLSKVVEF